MKISEFSLIVMNIKNSKNQRGAKSLPPFHHMPLIEKGI